MEEQYSNLYVWGLDRKQKGNPGDVPRIFIGEHQLDDYGIPQLEKASL
jgi:hypothetical protein